MAKDIYPPLILELTDRRDSVFAMEGTENTNEPDFLDTSSGYMLRNTSVVMINGVRTKTRYIQGCPYYLVDEQEKNGWKPNPKMDAIVFEFGRLTVERSGLFEGLYDYLLNHESNADNKNRPAGAETTFKQINTAASAEKEMENLDFLSEAMDIVSSLRVRTTGKGGNNFTYDAVKIDHLSKLFNIASLPTEAERLKVLLGVATSNPVYFLDLVRNAQGDLRVNIASARELGVISTDGPQASFKEDGKTFYKFKDKKNKLDLRITELVEYFNSPEGEMDLAILKTQLDLAQEKVLAVN